MITEVRHCPVVFQTRGPGLHFCGYYDFSPIDRPGKQLLTHRVSEAGRMPRPDDVVEVGVWDIPSNDYRALGTTRAYNWQQGAKLQWLGPDYASRIIFNDRVDDAFVAKVINTETGQEQTFDFPVYTVHPSGASAVCVNFERTYFPRPGYSYQGVVKRKWDRPVHADDGLFRLDLTSGEVKRIISMQDVLDHRPLSSMKGATHYLEHAMFNPDGSRFAFLHRWQMLGGGMIYTRAYTATEHGGDLRLLLDSGRFSHAGWRTPNELTAFAGFPTALGNVRKYRSLIRWVVRPLLPLFRKLFSPRHPLRQSIGAASYLHFQVDTGVWEELAPGEVWGDDGHMTWHPTNKHWMLTDTYEDEEFNRRLFLYHRTKNLLVEVGRFHSTPSTCSTGWRCDLHPRFDHEGKRVVIDSLHERDERQVYVIDVSGVIEEMS